MYFCAIKFNFLMYKFDTLEEIINHDVSKGFPGIGISVQHKGELVYKKVFGYAHRYDNQGKQLVSPQILTEDMLFDIASITKIFATTYAVMYLYERGQIDVDALITQYIPHFKLANTDYIPTIKDLLTHSTGLAPFFDFYNEHTAGEFFSQDRETTINYSLTKMPLAESPKKYCIYSDTGMMILGCVVEAIAGERLDVFVGDSIYKKLNLVNTCFNPLDKGFKPEQIAATQVDGHSNCGRANFANIKTYTLRGEVHDEKALYSMVGISGHAGLFTNLDDATKLASLLSIDNEFFSKQTLKIFSEQCAIDKTFALGFWTANGRRNRHLFGEKCSDETIGHTGFTGQCLISDPVNEITIMIMANSVHCLIGYPRIFEGKTFRSGKYAELIDCIYSELGF